MAPVHRRGYASRAGIARSRVVRRRTKQRGAALLLARADRRHFLGDCNSPRHLRRTGAAISALESQRSEFSGCRREWPIHTCPPRYLRRSWRARGGRGRRPRRCCARSRREKVGPKDSLPLRSRCRAHPHVPQLRATSRRLDEKSGLAVSEAGLARNANAFLVGISIQEFALALVCPRHRSSLLLVCAWRAGIRTQHGTNATRELRSGDGIPRRPIRHAHVRVPAAALEACARPRRRLLEGSHVLPQTRL